MPTTKDYIDQLKIDKQNLVDNLKAQGVQVSDNATFTDLAPTVLDIGGKANIYVQTTEPTDKKGIWIQTDKTYDDVIVDENVYANGVWRREYVGDCLGGKLFNYNGNDYLCSSMTTIYKIVGDGLQQITVSNPNNVNDNDAYCQIGNRIYGVDGSSGTYKYFSYLDLDNMTVYKDPDYKSNSYPQLYGIKVEGGDGYIYCFNCNSDSSRYTWNYCYKYDTVNHTITAAGTHSSSLSTGGSISSYAYNWYSNGIRAGNDIYLFMTNPGQSSGLTDDDKKHIFCMKYHILSNTFEKGYKTSIYADKGGFVTCPQIIDGKILLYCYGYGIYAIDTENNDEITKFADDYDDPDVFRAASGQTGIINGDEFNLFCITAYINGSSSTTSINKRLQLDLTSKSYQGNKVILQQYPYNPKYMAQIFSINGLKEPITNIFLYNNNTMYANLPTYIGNGTTWTKIKG